ncbi:DNA polymerase I [Castellaniella sp. GW247-6E4]|uniref:DNA polymerase I n=1 Tax=Castellaniella sp. GW247-6E4 TaxID=3140380 RepID=UPI003315F95C
MKKTLLLVDGSSYLYRAYHAMPDLRNARGEPTGALYGVISMLRRLLEDYKDRADYGACVFDAPGGSFREVLYPEYKANRPSMPEDLRAQVAPIHEAAAALGWTVIVQPGVEADDVIGTLARQASGEGFHTIISTGDKDLAQLVDEHVELINTMSGERQDIEGVVRKFGVPPERIVEFLMLTGDTIDNVPGVDKVGPKTAAKWLSSYGDIETLIARAGEIKGVAGENLRAALPNFPLTRDLLTIRLDCELPEGMRPSALSFRAPDHDTLLRLYEAYGFRSWLREATGDPQRIPAQDARVAPQVEAPAEIKYETVLDLPALERWVERIRGAALVAMDTETTSLDPMAARLVGISLSVEAGRACYIPVGHRGPGAPVQLARALVLERLRPWLEDPEAAKLLHHAKYDAHVLANEGVALRGVQHDTMLQAYVLESHRRVNLQELGQRWLGVTGTTYEDLCGKGARQIGFDEVDLERAAHYGAEDADFTLRLHEVLYPKVSADEGLERTYRLEIETSDVLTTVERNGVAIDAGALATQSHELGQQMIVLEGEAHALAGQPFNLNSPKQLGEILFQRMQLPVLRKTAGGAPSTDEEVLSRLAADYPLPRLLLEYRGLAKLKSTYTDKLPRMVDPRSGRVHTRYAQAAVITGRLASSDPNLQNIPVRTAEGRRVRTAFVSSLGRIVSADYSQIELRVMAHVSGDENLRRAFAEGLDIHRATAAEVFGLSLDEVGAEQRRAAKAINFGLIYGMGEFGLASNLGITRAAAKSYIDRYFMRYPGVAQYMDRIRKQAREQGYVQTVFGRRLHFPELSAGAKGPRAAAAERAAINAPMQGTAADLIKMAMVAVQRWLSAEGLRSLMVMQVHDELVFDAVEDEVERLRERVPVLMAGVAELAVPLVAEVGVGANWGEAH